LTSSSLDFITLPEGSTTYRKELSLPLSRVETVALVRYGNLGHLRQIHLKADLGLVVMAFGFGETERAERFFDALRVAGLRVATGGGYVRNADSAGMVPIFIPAR
jgi:hypothetical protein